VQLFLFIKDLAIHILLLASILLFAKPAIPALAKSSLDFSEV